MFEENGYGNVKKKKKKKIYIYTHVLFNNKIQGSRSDIQSSRWWKVRHESRSELKKLETTLRGSSQEFLAAIEDLRWG